MDVLKVPLLVVDFLLENIHVQDFTIQVYADDLVGTVWRIVE